MSANDFFVLKESGSYQLNSVTALMYAMAGSNADFTTFDVKILEDNGGTPGNEIFTKTNMTPLTYYEHNELYMGYKTYWVTLDLEGVGLDVNPNEDTRYWMVFQSHSLNNFDKFWVLYPYTEGWNTQPTYTSSDSGQTWTKVTQFGNGDHYDGFMEIESTCDTMGVNDLNKDKFSYYPNPVNNTLNIVTGHQIKNISVINLAGQVVGNLSAIDGKVDLSSLPTGVFVLKVVLDNKQIETFKIVKK